MANNPQKVTKAVIAAAGYGTRFLPQTKAMPKEMLPLIDKPIIQYIVEQLVDAGIKDIIIVGSGTKRAIEDHFDVPHEDLLANLRAGGPKKQPFIDNVEAVAELANFVYIRQKGPYGNATPLMNAAHLVGNEPIIYSYADDITVGEPNIFKQMIAMYEEHDASILPCIRVEDEIDFNRYGILEGEKVGDDMLKMTGMIEKPGKEFAPSDFASVGGYLLKPEVFGYIEKAVAELPEDKEFYTVDSLLMPMARDGHDLYGYIVKGDRYDTGDPLEYLKTIFDFGLAHPEYGEKLRKFLDSRLSA